MKDKEEQTSPMSGGEVTVTHDYETTYDGVLEVKEADADGRLTRGTVAFSSLKATADGRPIRSVTPAGTRIEISYSGKKVLVEPAGGSINPETRSVAADAARHLLFVNRQSLTDAIRVTTAPRAGDEWPLAQKALARFAVDDLDIQPNLAKGQARLAPAVTDKAAGGSSLQLVVEWQIEGHDAPVEGWKSESSRRSGRLRVSQTADPLARQIGEWFARRESTAVGTGEKNLNEKTTRRYETTGHLECVSLEIVGAAGRPGPGQIPDRMGVAGETQAHVPTPRRTLGTSPLRRRDSIRP